MVRWVEINTNTTTMMTTVGHFTVVCLVTWPMNASSLPFKGKITEQTTVKWSIAITVIERNGARLLNLVQKEKYFNVTD